MSVSLVSVGPGDDEAAAGQRRHRGLAVVEGVGVGPRYYSRLKDVTAGAVDDAIADIAIGAAVARHDDIIAVGQGDHIGVGVAACERDQADRRSADAPTGGLAQSAVPAACVDRDHSAGIASQPTRACSSRMMRTVAASALSASSGGVDLSRLQHFRGLQRFCPHYPYSSVPCPSHFLLASP